MTAALRVPPSVTEGLRDRRLLAAAIGGVAALTIGGAYVMQYGFGIWPCEVCLWQRPHYFVIVAAAAAAFAFERADGRRAWAPPLFGLIAGAALIGAALGVYHVGIEQLWWKGPDACAAGPGMPGSIDAMLQGLDTVRVVRCDAVAWSFLGLSLAGYNVLISLAVAAAALWALSLPARKDAR